MEIINTHRNADFDALSSVFAASILYPRAKAILPRAINPNVRAFLTLHKEHFPFLTIEDIDQNNVSRLIVVDTNNWARLDGVTILKGRKDLDVHMWDHHGDEGDIDACWTCCEKIGSTTTLLTEKLKENKENISPIQATLFLAGIYEDTGNLTFPATTVKDADSVAYLLGQKADLNIVNKFLRPTYGPGQKDVLFEMLKSGKREKVNGYYVSINKLRIEGHTPGLALVVDMYQDIMNVDAAFGIFSEEKKKRCMVIGRSSVEGLNIGSIMRSIGGGGHPNAGSALLKSVNPDEVKLIISELLKGNQRSSIQISDLMSYPVFTIAPDLSMKEAAMLLREKGCTGIPVADNGKVVGVISRSDISKVRKSSQMKSPVKAYMTKDVKYIDPSSSVVQAIRKMVKHKIGRLPVMENDKIIGIITRTDAMRYYYDLLHE